MPGKGIAEKTSSENFYDKIKPRLHKRIGRELRLARYVLDLGCGSCELVKYLADAYLQEVTGVDISSESFPKRHRSQNGVRFRCLQRDASDLGFMPAHFVDAVVMMWSLHEIDHPEETLREARRVLRPGGEVLVVDFPKDSLVQELWNEHYIDAH